MRLATLFDGSPDGRAVVVSRDATRCIEIGVEAPTMQVALERWPQVESRLRQLQQSVDAGAGVPFDPANACSPLPRAWQWLDASAFQAHGDLMSTVFKHDKLPYDERPLMYQGLSDRFLRPSADVPLPSEGDGVDFEGEFAVITDAVPMGVSAAEALRHVRLIAVANDWSLRRIAPIEMKTGFGWIQAKPASSMAPVAVTPDELGPAWRDGRVQMRLRVDLNGKRFGEAHAGAMAFGFGELIAHAAYSRDLVAGTVLGSGTVSNENYRVVGSSCIAERRAIEILDEGQARTPYMAFGDRVRMEAAYDDGRPGPFGVIDQRVVAPAR